MRYVLAAIFVCAIGMPEASALPMAGVHALSAAKASPIVQVSKRGHARAHRHGRGDGGIHPLVGSGDY